MTKLKFLLPLGFIVMTSFAAQTTTLVSLPNPGAQLLNQARLIKEAAADTQFSFNVWLKLRNKQDLDQLVQDVYDPKSPRYQQFLTRALFEEKFAPDQEAEEKVSHFFLNHGMQANIVNHSIRVTGSAAQIEQALHVQMNYYRYKNKVFHANAGTPRLMPEIAQYVAEITGLNTIPEFQENIGHAKAETQSTTHDLNFLENNFIPTALPTTISLQGFSGANLRKTYNLSNIPKINGVRLNGLGQTLVIVDKCGTNGPAQILSDANQYFKMNGIAPFIISGPAKNFAIVNPDGSPFTNCPNASSFSREIVLDIEASHTIASGDNTVLVLGTDQRTTLMDVINTLIQNNYTIAGFTNAYVISNSWSSPESFDAALESSLQLAAAAGISINFSSGDCGDNTYTNAGKCNGSPPLVTVNYPSSSAYVTAVGATALFVDNNYNYAFETVWGTVESVGGVLSYTGGTGGGISQFYGPVPWQSSISSFTAGGYGIINNFGNRRALPDVAMLGDPRTGLLIIANGTQVQDGGTSLACPLFSATLVLVNQARSLLNKATPIGQAAPYLYQQNNLLLANRAINLIIPPSIMINGATQPPSTLIDNTPAPASSFTIGNVTFGWDSSLTLEPENQFWNDGVGVGSPNIPNFVMAMANM
ncbi:S53 family peptidase [Legionella feeleii]|uniref:Serine protease, subtilase family n=1 Tax=Legionella feeleii TaxID=453 RepID=A0A0W0U4I0_9GAMM|nr:S53 family peptidase [Legionella feeleii]KTD02832.1 serine protease, subtilase family [Legionella feeleii]SPX59925.1 serine protease, subtilase family [Legionella feeleii]